MAKTSPLPENDDAERFVLGSVLLNPDLFVQVSGALAVGDFSRESHRRIFSRMKDLAERGEKIDRITVANELLKQGQIESVGGLSYLVSLDEGLPQLVNLDSYIRIVKDNRDLRVLAFLGQYLQDQAKTRLPPLDIVYDVQTRLQEIERGAAVLDKVPVLSDVIDSLGGALEIINPTAAEVFIPTGFTRWDSMTGGLEVGKLAIIAGRPSSGKTSLAMCMAQNIAESNVPVAMFSLEMSHRGLIDRMVCVKSQLDFSKYKGRRLNADEKEQARYAIGRLYEIPLFIDEKPFHSIGDISRKLDRLAHKHDVKVCFLDYVQLLTSGLRHKGDRRNTTEILGEAVEGLKSLGKRLGVAMVLLSQLNRDSEKRGGSHRPMLSDLKDSSSLEQAADLVAFTFREYQYKSDQEHLRDYCEVIISKARDGKTGIVPMKFRGDWGGAFADI